MRKGEFEVYVLNGTMESIISAINHQKLEWNQVFAVGAMQKNIRWLGVAVVDGRNIFDPVVEGRRLLAVEGAGA
jgi:hypothetical protein